ncbi:MAG: dihydroorotate dehydrogenase-like protein [Tannerella sp.]|jgi:dihydroorotate dehydrogenase (fumarate)|nr:dihydroorotate dehydrogenase-like protein [Tannerella sp.]
MTGTETKYAGLTLRNPLIVGSSGLTNSAKRNKELEKAGAGAIVLKSLFEEQIEMHIHELTHTSDAPEAADYVRSYARADQVGHYTNLISETKAQCSIPVIASINCYKADSWIDFASRIEAAGADALELNIFYLLTALDFDCAEVVELYTSILRKVKKQLSIPVIMKIGKNFSNIPSLVNQLKGNGADGVVLFNRFYQPDVDINKMQIVSGQVFSSHSDMGDTLRWTALVAGKVPGISIATSSGVHDWEDVIKCLLVGASAVQLCSAIYMHGAEILTQMLTCIEEWMHLVKYQSLSEFIGKLNSSNIENPLQFERAQFMKYFSGRDD